MVLTSSEKTTQLIPNIKLNNVSLSSRMAAVTTATDAISSIHIPPKLIPLKNKLNPTIEIYSLLSTNDPNSYDIYLYIISIIYIIP